MTDQTQSQPNIDANDLDLVDDRLEDEGKDDAELWQEFDQAETAATSDDPDDQLPGDKPGSDKGDDWDAADDGKGQDTGDGSAPGSGGSDDAPSATSRQSDGKTPPDDANRQQAQDQVWANATPEQRAAYEAAQDKLRKLEQADRSNRGRLSAMQRQINELTAKPAASREAAKGQDGDQGDDGFLASDDWKSFQNEYPEVAGPLGKLIGSLQSEITRQSKELSAIGSERRQSALDEQANLLAEEHSDWQDVVADQGFGDWLQQQPRHIKEAAVRNATEIVDWEEAADVVGRYKQFRAQQGGGNAQQQESSRADANAGQDTGNNRLAGKRQRQLESATTARSRGPGAASGVSEDSDPETIWKQFDEMERRQARA